MECLGFRISDSGFACRPSASPLVPSPLSSIATIRFPSPSRSANSTASASRGRTFGPATSRSTTTSMLCRIWRSSRRSSLRRTTRPSTRARTNPCFKQVGEQVAIFALLAADQRRQHEKSRAGRQGHDAVDDLLAGLGGDRPAALRTMPLAHPGVEHPQVIVNLGDRADGGARVLPAGLLRDRNGRVQPGDQVHVGLGHLPEELPGEARQALHVPPLPLGIQRVEGQRALARPAHAREANQPVSRQQPGRRRAGCALGRRE